MRFSVFAALAAVPAVVLAQQKNITILVGDQGAITYNPPSVTANVGDIIIFEFRALNHTVTQSTFADPCDPAVNATTGQVGFDSGFNFAVPANSDTFPTWSIEIQESTTPIWFYCRQTGHCKKGMVGAINAATTGNKTFAAFQALAMGTTTGGSSAAPGSASGSPSNTASTPSQTPKNAASSQKVMGSGAALLAVAGLVAGLFL